MSRDAPNVAGAHFWSPTTLALLADKASGFATEGVLMRQHLGTSR